MQLFALCLVAESISCLIGQNSLHPLRLQSKHFSKLYCSLASSSRHLSVWQSCTESFADAAVRWKASFASIVALILVLTVATVGATAKISNQRKKFFFFVFMWKAPTMVQLTFA